MRSISETRSVLSPTLILLAASVFIAAMTVGAGCPSFDLGDIAGTTSDTAGTGDETETDTCPEGQFLLPDGTCHDCASSLCPDGQYLGYDGNCYPSPEGCPNYTGGTVATAISHLDDPNVAAELYGVGDGQEARRRAMPVLFPEVQDLIAGGDAAAESVLEKFQGLASGDDDLSLSIYAYVLEQMGGTAAIPQLAEFLDDNITGAVPDTVSAVTHALRVLMADSASPPDDTASYLASEIETTLADAGSSKYSTWQAKGGSAGTCLREFYLLDANGDRISDGKGDYVKVGGTAVNPADDAGFADNAGKPLGKKVTGEGGTYVSYIDPETGATIRGWKDPESGVIFEGYPTKRFNCAGYAFRNFNDGQRWLGDPGRMLDSLTKGGALESISEHSAVKGDFVFFWSGSDDTSPAHVAVVDTPSGWTGTTTVINADGPTGIFTAPVNAKWFDKYQKKAFYRWKDGTTPQIEVNTDRSKDNSCFGSDADNDGWPEGSTCDATQECIDSAFEPGFRVYTVPIGSGQLEVLQEGSENEQIPMCQFSGGGLDCTVMAVLTPITPVFPAAEDAVKSLCSRIENIAIWPLGIGPAADFDGASHFLSWDVYDILGTCPG